MFIIMWMLPKEEDSATLRSGWLELNFPSYWHCLNMAWSFFWKKLTRNQTLKSESLILLQWSVAFYFFLHFHYPIGCLFWCEIFFNFNYVPDMIMCIVLQNKETMFEYKQNNFISISWAVSKYPKVWWLSIALN